MSRGKAPTPSAMGRPWEEMSEHAHLSLGSESFTPTAAETAQQLPLKGSDPQTPEETDAASGHLIAKVRPRVTSLPGSGLGSVRTRHRCGARSGSASETRFCSRSHQGQGQTATAVF